MCDKPIEVFNNTHSFDPEYSPLRFRVPCGSCPSCQDSRSREWQVRSYYEYLNNQKSNGQTFFYTLTFNNTYVPRYRGVLCFDWKLVDNFIKRLRHQLDERGITLKVLLTSEFGELYKRPHHHALFFLYGNRINPLTFRRLLEFCWSDCSSPLRKQYGFIKSGDNLGLVTSYRAVTYTAKYCTKDFSFRRDSRYIFISLLRNYLSSLSEETLASLPRLRTLRSSVKAKSVLSSDLYAFRLQFVRDFKHICPFIKYSLGFGSCSLDYLTSADLSTDTIKIPNGGEYITYSLPRYLIRKLYYERVYNIRTSKKDLYRLTDEGVQHFVSRGLRAIDDILSNNDNIYSFAVNHLRDDASLQPLFDHYENLRQVLPYYRSSYRWFLSDVQSFDDISSSFEQRLFNIYNQRKFQPYEYTLTSYLEGHTLYFGDLHVIEPLESVQHCLDVVSDYQAALSSAKRQESERIRRRLKQYDKLKTYKPLHFSCVS